MDSQIHPDILHFISKNVTPEWSHDDVLEKYSITYIESGAAEYEVDGCQFTASQGEMVFLKPGNRRKSKTNGMNVCVIDFRLPKGEDIDLPTIFKPGKVYLRIKDMEYEWLQRNPGFMMKSQALLMLILHKLIYERDDFKKNEHVELIKHHIMQNYTKKITVKGIADSIGLNPVYCGALFKKVESCTINEFITHIRINRAISLLESGDSNIGRIAEYTGYNDVYSFSNTFKKIVGVSPSMYKNRNN